MVLTFSLYVCMHCIVLYFSLFASSILYCTADVISISSMIHSSMILRVSVSVSCIAYAIAQPCDLPYRVVLLI